MKLSLDYKLARHFTSNFQMLKYSCKIYLTSSFEILKVSVRYLDQFQFAVIHNYFVFVFLQPLSGDYYFFLLYSFTLLPSKKHEVNHTFSIFSFQISLLRSFSRILANRKVVGHIEMKFQVRVIRKAICRLLWRLLDLFS